jgi:hypothetical protein
MSRFNLIRAEEMRRSQIRKQVAMRLRTRFFAAFAALGLSASPAAAASLDVAYGIWLAGLPLGQAGLKSSFEGSRYNLSVQARLTGLAGILTSGRGAANASGAFANGRALPSNFAVTSRSTKDSRTVRMGLASGSVAAVEITPPIEPHPDRVPVAPAHRQGVLDPLSALLMPASTRGDVLDAGNCDRTIPVFDGASRFNVVLSFVERKDVEKPGYKGPVLVCRAKWIPISGHRPARRAVKFMEDNDDMSVWLAPIDSARVLVPMRIAVRTMIGMSVIEAEEWRLEPAATASVPARPTRAKN